MNNNKKLICIAGWEEGCIFATRKSKSCKLSFEDGISLNDKENCLQFNCYGNVYRPLKVGQKVKIRVENFEKIKHQLHPDFIKFLEKNKDVIFTIKKYPKRPNGILWTFEEDETWNFHENDLKIVEE